MRWVRRGTLVLGALALSGCISLTTVVHVQPDGTGTLTQTTLLQPAMVEMLRGFAAMGEQGVSAAPDLFPEKDLRSKVEQMGPGVTFVSSRKIKDDRGEGVEAVYAFKDVNTLRIQERPAAPGGANATSPPESGPQLTLTHLPNGHALLTVIPEKGQGSSDATTEKKPTQEHEKPFAEQMAQAKKMLKGLHIAMVVDAGKKIVRTNSPFVDGHQVTLLELDFEALLSNPEKLEQLMAMGKPDSLDAAKKILKDIPGVKVALEPKIEIEFE